MIIHGNVKFDIVKYPAKPHLSGRQTVRCDTNLGVVLPWFTCSWPLEVALSIVIVILTVKVKA